MKTPGQFSAKINMLGIARGLRGIFVDDDAGLRWLRGANIDQPFNGRSPLEVMLRGTVAHLHDVRAYLDGWCGGRM